LEFHIQEGTAQEWKRIVDTALPSPDDFSDHSLPLEQAKYLVAPRSVVILLRHRKRMLPLRSLQGDKVAVNM
jgi:isoamylase